MPNKVSQNVLVCFVVLATLSATSCASITEDLTSSWLGPEFGVLQKVYDDCQNKNDFTGCLKGKALVALTKAADQVMFVIYFFTFQFFFKRILSLSI